MCTNKERTQSIKTKTLKHNKRHTGTPNGIQFERMKHTIWTKIKILTNGIASLHTKKKNKNKNVENERKKMFEKKSDKQTDEKKNES